MTALSARLAEIEARAGAATPGPWGVNSAVSSNELCDYTVYGIPGVASATWTGDDSPAFAYCDGMSRADAEFIAAARTDVPALVAALRAVWEFAARERGTILAQYDITGATLSEYRGFANACGDVLDIITEALGVEL